jgi:hypothetical protein
MITKIMANDPAPDSNAGKALKILRVLRNITETQDCENAYDLLHDLGKLAKSMKGSGRDLLSDR